MSKLKTYEEFNWTPEDTGFLTKAAEYALYLIVFKLGSKLLTNKREKDRFREMMSGGMYTSSHWSISDVGGIISIRRVYGVGTDTPSEKAFFTIDKKNRIFEYTSDSTNYNLKVKLSRSDLKETLDGVYFAKDVADSIDDCFYDLTDEGFKVSLSNLNFARKSFVVRVYLVGDKESWGRDKRFGLNKIGLQLDETLQKITGQYDVVIDENPEVSGFARDGHIVTKYENGVITIVPFQKIMTSSSSLLSDDIDLRNLNDSTLPKLSITRLTIPFIRK